jgi:hypothetical protein
LNIRVRTRWNTVRQTLKSAAVTLQQLKVDGKIVSFEEVIKKSPRGEGTADVYYLYKWGTPSKGLHQIEATVKDLSTNAVKTYKETFIQK